MLARSGFVTLAVTGAPGLAGHHAKGALDLEAAPNAVVAAFKYLCAREDVDPRRVGLMGVCIGGGACLLAAARPELAREVRFVFLIGPYVSLRSVLRAIASRTAMSADGRMRPWQPSEWTVERQRAWLARRLSPAERAAVLLAVARHDPAPMALSSHGQAVFELVTGASPDRADQLIETLGDAFSKMLEAVSPAGCLADVRAETLVMHSVDDGLIPVEESRRLADALRGQVSLQYAEFELFEHVDVSRSLAAMALVREVWRLVRHARWLMRFACSVHGVA
jgi:acetyl esterase/lipase